MATNDPTTGMPPMIGRGLSTADWLAYVAWLSIWRGRPVARGVGIIPGSPPSPSGPACARCRRSSATTPAKGWTAAPHIFVGPDAIWLFTPLKDVGIHAGTGNSGTSGGRFWYSIGIETVGDYDRARPSGPVWEHTKAVLGGLSRRLSIPPRQLFSFHRDYTNQKSCPGWAVTKEWVFGEIESWLANRPPPPAPPPGPIGNPSPEVAALVEALMEQSYARRGEGYNSDWAFHQYAVQNSAGRPDRQERAAPGRWQELRLPAVCPRYAVQRDPQLGRCAPTHHAARRQDPSGRAGARAARRELSRCRRRDPAPRLGLPPVCGGQPARPADRREHHGHGRRRPVRLPGFCARYAL